MKQSKFMRGSSLVEFALVLPILAVVLFAIIQYGFIFATYITIRNASAVGARSAVLGTTNNAVLRAQAAMRPMLDPSKAPLPTITPTNLTTSSGAMSTGWVMTVSYPLPIIIPYVVPGSLTNKLLTATTTIW